MKSAPRTQVSLETSIDSLGSHIISSRQSGSTCFRSSSSSSSCSSLLFSNCSLFTSVPISKSSHFGGIRSTPHKQKRILRRYRNAHSPPFFFPFFIFNLQTPPSNLNSSIPNLNIIKHMLPPAIPHTHTLLRRRRLRRRRVSAAGHGLNLPPPPTAAHQASPQNRPTFFPTLITIITTTTTASALGDSTMATTAGEQQTGELGAEGAHCGRRQVDPPLVLTLFLQLLRPPEARLPRPPLREAPAVLPPSPLRFHPHLPDAGYFGGGRLGVVGGGWAAASGAAAEEEEGGSSAVGVEEGFGEFHFMWWMGWDGMEGTGTVLIMEELLIRRSSRTPVSRAARCRPSLLQNHSLRVVPAIKSVGEDNTVGLYRVVLSGPLAGVLAAIDEAAMEGK
ncbi:tobamovirus multiplication 1 [Striga asiatica]|uniref:Tobamovirus multiplication 1 n=1 Tax=Striga asiatica TaxID=4170 RepID=A0A5A7R7G8_STRAF|nr:tobamovirus multiplication 1 [Striga asiatica]